MNKQKEWLRQLGDMSVCPDCHTKQYPIRDIENLNRQDCTNRCGAYIYWNHRRKVPRAEWTSENWG